MIPNELATTANCSSCAGGGDVVMLDRRPRHSDNPSVTTSDRFAVDSQFRSRLVARIENDFEFCARVSAEIEGPDRTSIAERILDQALGFLAVVADSPGVSYSPSPLVDIGWHNFILYTREYAEWCTNAAGRFIHHTPFDEVGHEHAGQSGHTVRALRDAGWPVDDELWTDATISSCNRNPHGTKTPDSDTTALRLLRSVR